MSAPNEPSAELRFEPREAGRIAWLTVSHPGKINILNGALIGDLRVAIADAVADKDLRAIVLTGGGERAFIGGADIREMAALDADSARGFITHLHELCHDLRTAPVPVIARIRGYCLGGGLEVAAACDLRAAADDAVFGMPEVRVGIPSVIEAALLPRLIGAGKARELVLTGRTLDAAEAAACGLVERVVSPDGLDAVVDSWLADILACGRNALRLQKELIHAWENRPLDEAIAAGIDSFVEAFETSDEPTRLMRAFLDRQR